MARLCEKADYRSETYITKDEGIFGDSGECGCGSELKLLSRKQYFLFHQGH